MRYSVLSRNSELQLEEDCFTPNPDCFLAQNLLTTSLDNLPIVPAWGPVLQGSCSLAVGPTAAPGKRHVGWKQPYCLAGSIPLCLSHGTFGGLGVIILQASLSHPLHTRPGSPITSPFALSPTELHYISRHFWGPQCSLWYSPAFHIISHPAWSRLLFGCLGFSHPFFFF